MNDTSLIGKNSQRLLTIIIGVLCAVFALWYLFGFILFEEYANNAALSNNSIAIFFKAKKTFSFLLLLLNLLLLIWYIITMNSWKKNVWITAVIGLSIAIILGFINRYIVQHLPNASYDTVRFIDACLDFSSFFGNISTVLLGISFVLFSHQFDNKLKKMARFIGLLYFASVMIVVFDLIFRFALPKNHLINSYEKILHYLNLTNRIVFAVRLGLMAFFFLGLSRLKQKKTTAEDAD
ncbi:MAG: hypothetical protein IKX35_05320 [Bacteroidales bacterium]|nr:hypothetical protein [Bacteroidales bacterium]